MSSELRPGEGSTPGEPQATEEGIELLVDDDAVFTSAAEEPSVAAPTAPAPQAPPPQRRNTLAPGPAGTAVTDQDREFIRRVFAQVRDVDFRAPPPPPPRKDLAGPDKKIAGLRQTVHELERDLARVAFIWGEMQQQFETADRLVLAKEAERDAAIQRYQQIKELSGQTAMRDRAEAESLRKRIAELEAHKQNLEQEVRNLRAEAERNNAAAAQRIARLEQEKAALLADFRAKIEAAQSAFNQLREQSTRAMAELEARARKGDDDLAAKAQELDVALVTIAERSRALDEQRATVAERDRALAQLKDEKQQVEQRLAERDRTLASFADEMSKARTESEQRAKDLRDALLVKDDLVEATRGEVRSARAEFEQLAIEYEKRKAEIKALGDKAAADEQQRVALDARVRELSEELTRRDERLTTGAAELQRREAALSDAGAQLEALDQRVNMLAAELQKRVERITAVEAELQRRDAALADAGAELAVLRAANAELDALRGAKIELEQLRAAMQAGQEAAQPAAKVEAAAAPPPPSETPPA